MRITQISVNGLFGRFDHEISFGEGEAVKIILGPNGSGKTMILRIINALFNHPVRSIGRYPFRTVIVTFDDGSQLAAKREERYAPDGKVSAQVEVVLKQSHGGAEKQFRPDQLNPREIPLGAVDDVVPELDRVGPTEWRNRRTGETLSLEDVFDRYSEELATIAGVTAGAVNAPDWFQRIRSRLPVRFIDTERLNQPMAAGPRSRARYGVEPQRLSMRTVRRYAEDLAERVEKTLTEYGALSQKLDRTFPVRLVSEPTGPDVSMDKLRKDLADVEAKRKQLVESGLLAADYGDWNVPSPSLDSLDDARRGVLAVYARDAREKLGVFDDLYARVVTLTRIANARLLRKRVRVGSKGLTVVSSDGGALDLEMLSSGEQHELVLLYELLFKVSENSLILIDEPELSLHVAWQEEFLNDLTEVAKLSQFRALLATHSPQVIGDRWDLTVELVNERS
jgi:ABC-type lipoprotein export system ATPase subunit